MQEYHNQKLTKAQKMMVEDGMPAELMVSEAERRAQWTGSRPRPTRSMFSEKHSRREEDPATTKLRRELAAEEARKKAERFARLSELRPKRAKPQPQEDKMITMNAHYARTPPQSLGPSQTSPVSKRVDKSTAEAIQAFESNPRLSIPCPKCNAQAGSWCRSESGRKLPDLHAGRQSVIGEPQPVSLSAAAAAKKSGSKLTPTTAKNRREVGSIPSRPGVSKPKKPDFRTTTAGSGVNATDRPASKSEIVHRMLISPDGATRRELSEASGWPSVNLTTAAKRADMKIVEDEATGKVRLVPKK